MIQDDIKFYALIVLYNPEDKSYIKNIQSLLQVNIKVIIYDNSTSLEIIEDNQQNIAKIEGDTYFYHNNANNLGLSYAFNDAINKLDFLKNQDGIFIFDQDSIITIESISFLINSFKKLINETNFGILAGYPLRKNGEPYRVRKLDMKCPNHLMQVYQIPSSYSLIPMKTFRTIGNFEKDFFIDQIDNNYSLRCVKNNLNIYIDTRAKFIHDIGLGDVMFFNKFLFPYSTPDRHYYQTRNLILSYKRYKIGNIKLAKKLVTRCVIIGYIGIAKGNLFNRLYYMFRGIKDGLSNKGGKLV